MHFDVFFRAVLTLWQSKHSWSFGLRTRIWARVLIEPGRRSGSKISNVTWRSRLRMSVGTLALITFRKIVRFSATSFAISPCHLTSAKSGWHCILGSKFSLYSAKGLWDSRHFTFKKSIFFSAEHEALPPEYRLMLKCKKKTWDGWQSGNTPKASSKFLTKTRTQCWYYLGHYQERPMAFGKAIPDQKGCILSFKLHVFMHSFVRISVGFNQPVLFWSSWASKNRLSRMESIRGKSDLVKRVVSRGSKQVS